MPTSPAIDLDIDALLGELGFSDGQARDAARAELVSAQLTRSGKQRISSAKRETVVSTLKSALVVACAREGCQAEAGRSGRRVVPAGRPADCEICAGSINARELGRAIEAMRRRGWSRLVVVGGSPAVHQELRAIVGDQIALRLVPGDTRRYADDARRDVDWADLVVVWGGTILAHHVSRQYTDIRSDRVILIARRGITSLAAGIVEAAARRRRP